MSDVPDILDEGADSFCDGAGLLILLGEICATKRKDSDYLSQAVIKKILELGCPVIPVKMSDAYDIRLWVRNWVFNTDSKMQIKDLIPVQTKKITQEYVSIKEWIRIKSKASHMKPAPPKSLFMPKSPSSTGSSVQFNAQKKSTGKSSLDAKSTFRTSMQYSKPSESTVNPSLSEKGNVAIFKTPLPLPNFITQRKKLTSENSPFFPQLSSNLKNTKSKRIICSEQIRNVDNQDNYIKKSKLTSGENLSHSKNETFVEAIHEPGFSEILVYSQKGGKIEKDVWPTVAGKLHHDSAANLLNSGTTSESADTLSDPDKLTEKENRMKLYNTELESEVGSSKQPITIEDLFMKLVKEMCAFDKNLNCKLTKSELDQLILLGCPVLPENVRHVHEINKWIEKWMQDQEEPKLGPNGVVYKRVNRHFYSLTGWIEIQNSGVLDPAPGACKYEIKLKPFRL